MPNPMGSTARDRILARAQQMGEVRTAELPQREAAPRSTGEIADIGALGAGNYGAGKRIDTKSGVDVDRLVGDTVKKGVNEIAKGGGSLLAALEDVVLAPAELVAGKKLGTFSDKGLFNRWNDSISAEGAAVDAAAQENTKNSPVGRKVYEYGAATINALPQVIMAMLTAGGSEAASAAQLAQRAAATASPSVAGTVSRAMQSMAKDKNFWTAAGQVMGRNYEDALADGASMDKALLYAIGNGLMNAAVEVGGGIQTLPAEMRGGAAPWKAWVSSMLDEGKEEVVQGVIERAMQNTVYGKGAPLVGVGNGAVLDPKAAAEEFAGGAVVGGILSGGQIGVQQLLGRAGRGNAAPSAAQQQGQTQDVKVDTQPQNAAEGLAGGHAAVNENGLASLTEQERINLSSGAKNKVVTTFQDAVQFVRNALKNKGNVDRAYLGKVPESTAQRVMQETGINIDGMGVMMNGVDVRHIIKEHGDPIMEPARGQVTVTAEAIARIPEVIAQPDAVYLSDTNDAKGRRAIVFEKRFGDTYITVQGVSNGKNLLQTDTLYIQKGKARTPRYSMIGTQESAAPEINARSVPSQGLSSVDTTVPQGTADVNTQDMQGGGEYAKDSDGLGGADRGTLNSDFQNMQMESDAFHPVNRRAEERLRSEQNRAPSEVPEVNPNTRENISKTVSTILNASITSSEMAPVLEQSVAEGRFDYVPVTDQAAMDRANSTIDRNGGYQKAAGIFAAKVELGQRVTKDDFALGVQCYNEAVAAGDAATALGLAGDLADAARTGAQVTQAVNLLNRLTPAGKLLTLRRYVDKLDWQGSPRRARRGDNLTADQRRAMVVEEASTYAIDQQLATDYMMAETDAARAEAWQAIIDDIASRVKPTALEKWNTWRYTAMLTNPVTHVRNLAGNSVQMLMRKTKNAVGAALESAFVRDSGQRTKSFLTHSAEDTARRELAAELYEQDKGRAMGAGKYREGSPAGIAREIESARKMFGEKYAVGKGVQAVSDWNSAALDWGDALFNRPAYIESLSQAMKARGITAAEARGGGKADLMESARDYAVQEAAKATYRDFNTFSEFASKLGRIKESDNWVQRGVGHGVEAILPFRRTPANILVRGVVDYSPVSFARVLGKDIRAVKNGTMEASEMIDHISSGLTGTGILLLGAVLAKNGLLHTKAGDDDREGAFLKSIGYQDFALQIGDASYTLDWMVPAAMPLFAGAAMMEGVSGDKNAADALGDALAGISDVVLETSMLSSLDQVIDNVSYADNKPWYALSSALTSYISQGVPTVGGKVANLLDDTARKAYVPSNAGEVSGDLQYFGQSLLRKVPGGRNTLQPNVDVWGQEISNGSLTERLAESFVSPGFISVAKDDAVTEEVRRLAGKVGSGVYPAKAEKSFEVNGKREYLDGDRYTAYAKALGQGRHRMLEQAMQASGYRTMRDADKAEMISALYQYANAKAKKAVVPEYTMTKAMQKYADAEKAGVSPAEWYLLKAGVDTDGSGGVSQKEAKAALDLSGLTEREKAAVWPLFNAQWAGKNPYT